MKAEYGNNLNLEERKEISGIFTKEYYELGHLNGSTYVSLLILQLFESIGILPLLKDKYSSSAEIIAEFKFNPKTKYALEWMLSFLSQGGFLKKREGNDGRRYLCEGVPNIDPQELLEKTLKLDRKIAPSVKLIDYVISEYPNFFKGLKQGLEILFTSDGIELWNEYFSNNNSGYGVHNALGAFGVLKWSAEMASLRLLEVGGGTAGATSSLIDKLKEKNILGKVSEYIFSDVSPIFLRLGNRAIMSRVGDDFQYALKKVDFNKPLVEQGLREAEIDIVYGVNTLHVAKNLIAALKNIYPVIKPSGKIILSESCRPKIDYLLPQEIIFNLLDNYADVDLDENLRPVPGFLDYEHWRSNLDTAGFKNIGGVFNTDGSYDENLRAKAGILAVVIKGEKA